MRNRRFAAIFISLACASCDGSDPDDVPTSSAHQNVWGGLPPGGSNDSTGILRTQIGKGAGSAIALNNRWVLTAKHVREIARVGDRDYANIAADFNDGGTTYHPTEGTIVATKPPFIVPPGGTILDRKYDLEVFRFDNPHPISIGGSQKNFHTTLTTKDTSQIISLGAVLCAGYGLGGPSGNAGVLRQGILQVNGTPINNTVLIGEAPDPINLAPPINFFTTITNQQQIAPGDSGGPCFDTTTGELVGINRAVSSTTNPAPKGVITSAGAFTGLNVNLRRLAQNDPEKALFADVDFDDQPDLLMLAAKDDGNGVLFADPQLQIADTSNYIPGIVPADGFIDFDDIGLGLPIHIPISEIPNAAITAGDFNQNGAQDFVGFIGGQSFYFDGLEATLPIVHLDLSLDCLTDPSTCFSFSPLTTAYSALSVDDVDADGIDDLDALDATDVYYGSAHGLINGVPMAGFPTSNGRDGKLITLAVRPVASVGVPDYTFAILHDATDIPQFHLEIFDGDLSGTNDTVTANSDSINTCYRLYADPDQTQLRPDDSVEPLFTIKQDVFVNNAWRSMLAPNSGDFPQAETSVPGIHAYVLRMFLSTDPCDQPPAYPDEPVANGLKLRVNGDIAFVSEPDPVIGVAGAISFRGSDSIGDFAAVDDCTLATCDTVELQDVDTTYDGDWQFHIDTIGGTFLQSPGGISSFGLSSLWLADSDADSTLDKRSPGDALGKSDVINFSVEDDTDANHTVLYQPSHPSGQFDPNLEPCVNYEVTNNGADLPGFLNWHWTQVPTHNNIWIAIPVTQPNGQCVDPAPDPPPVLSFALRGEKPRKPIPTNTASPASFWASKDSRPATDGLLPITVGEQGSCGKLVGDSSVARTAGQVDNAFRKAQHKPHPDTTGLLQDLEAEDLAAKLNIARGLTHGERISRGFIYGTAQNVGDLIAQVDDAIGRSCIGSSCFVGMSCEHLKGNKGSQVVPPTDAELTKLLQLMQALNAGRVTYRPPVVPAPSAAVRANAAHVSLVPGQGNGTLSPFWRKY